MRGLNILMSIVDQLYAHNELDKRTEDIAECLIDCYARSKKPCIIPEMRAAGLKQIIKNFVGRRAQNALNWWREKNCGPESRPLEKGELHYGCHNYTGPGTQIEKHPDSPPINAIDNCSRAHDLAYQEAKGDFNAVQKADREALECYARNSGVDGYRAATAGIGSKYLAERAMGKLIYGGNSTAGMNIMSYETSRVNPAAVQGNTADQIVHRPQDTVRLNAYRGSGMGCGCCGAGLDIDQHVGRNWLSAPTSITREAPVFGRHGWNSNVGRELQQPLHSNRPFSAEYPAPLPTAYMTQYPDYYLPVQGSQSGYSRNYPPYQGDQIVGGMLAPPQINEAMLNACTGNTKEPSGGPSNQHVGRNWLSAPTSITREAPFYKPDGQKDGVPYKKAVSGFDLRVGYLPEDATDAQKLRGWLTLSEYMDAVGYHKHITPAKKKEKDFFTMLLDSLYEKLSIQQKNILLENLKTLDTKIMKKLIEKYGTQYVTNNYFFKADDNGVPKDPVERGVIDPNAAQATGVPGIYSIAFDRIDRNALHKSRAMNRRMRGAPNIDIVDYANLSTQIDPHQADTDEKILDRLELTYPGFEQRISARILAAAPDADPAKIIRQPRADNLATPEFDPAKIVRDQILREAPVLQAQQTIPPQMPDLTASMQFPINIKIPEAEVKKEVPLLKQGPVMVENVEYEAKTGDMPDVPETIIDVEQVINRNGDVKSVTLYVDRIAEAIQRREGGNKEEIAVKLQEAHNRAMNARAEYIKNNPQRRIKPMTLAQIERLVLANYYLPGNAVVDTRTLEKPLKTRINGILAELGKINNEKAKKGRGIHMITVKKRGGKFRRYQILPKSP